MLLAPRHRPRRWPGELVALVGRVGSGKSSVVSAALGNMGVARRSPSGTNGGEDSSPIVRRGGRVALVAQGAWIANASLKDNVLFGEDFEESRWQQALDAACLGPDLDTLPGREEVEIGEKGINLSGGQKQRVALARACYADADVYLFDDPLSALDVHVGAKVFDKLVLDLRRRGKAVLLATNQLQFLPYADRVCYLENGRIAAQGAPQDASLRDCAGFQELLADYEATARACGESGTVAESAAAQPPAAASSSSSPPLDDGSAVSRARQQRADALLSSATQGTGLPRVGSEGAASASASASAASAAAWAFAAAAAPAPPRQPASPSSSSSSSRLLRRVPTFAIEQETRLEALHDAAGGVRGLNRAGGVPPLESAFARESGPRPGERGDGGGDNGDDAVSDAASGAEGVAEDVSSSSSSSSRRHSLSALPSPRRDNSLGAGFLDLVTGNRRGASLEIGGGPTLASRSAAAAASRQSSHSLSLQQQQQRRQSSGSLPATPKTAAAAAAAAANVATASKDAEDAAAATDDAQPDAAKTGGTLVLAEQQEEGAVGSAVYSFYIARYGRAAFTALILLWASEQSARVLTNWWLSRWTGAEALAAVAAAAPGSPVVDVKRTLRLGGYLGLSLAFVLFSCLRSATNLTSAARASKSVHAAALGALARSPVSFFDQTPVGRSLNRFSRDLDDVDYLLPQSLNDAGNCVAQLASALVFIAIVQPFFLAGLAPILLFYYLLTVSFLFLFFFSLSRISFLLLLSPLSSPFFLLLLHTKHAQTHTNRKYTAPPTSSSSETTPSLALQSSPTSPSLFRESTPSVPLAAPRSFRTSSSVWSTATTPHSSRCVPRISGSPCGSSSAARGSCFSRPCSRSPPGSASLLLSLLCLSQKLWTSRAS